MMGRVKKYDHSLCSPSVAPEVPLGSIVREQRFPGMENRLANDIGRGGPVARGQMPFGQGLQYGDWSRCR